MEGGEGPGRGPQGPRKGKTMLHLIEISLYDSYNGVDKKMRVNRLRICKECEGKGGKEDSIAPCNGCSGMGRVAKMVRMGFMVTQMIAPCDECQGRGKIIKDKCKNCKGRCVVEEEKVLELNIEKGTPEGHRFVFKEDADEYVSSE